jgi:flagellar hook-length control protein FliK
MADQGMMGQGVASQNTSSQNTLGPNPSGPNASGPNRADQPAQFIAAEGGSDAITVRVAGPALAQPAAVGSPLIAPGTALAAMSAETANPARAGEPAPSGAPQASGEEGGSGNSAFKPAGPTTGQGMAPAAQAGGQAAANNKATAEAAGGTVPTTTPATAPATGQAAAGLVDTTLGSSQAGASNPAAPPAPPAHPRWATPVQTPASQVGARLAAQAGDGSRSYDIQLDPANLGRVRVHLDVGKDGAVTASISADRSDTLMMLRSDARTLQQALQDAGLSTTAGSLEFSLSGQRRDGGAWGGGTGGNLQALRDDSTGESRQPDITPSAISPTGRPGRGSRAVDLKV